MVLVKVFPVVLMVLIGMICKRKGIISMEGMAGLKTLATNFMLPVLLFHTLATTSYSKNTLVIVGIMLVQLCVSFAFGMILRLTAFPDDRFLPFLVSSFEGGMLGYPLYVVLCGEDQLSNIAKLDIANTMFVFTVFLAFLMSTVSGNFRKKDMVSNIIHSPVFWGVFLGIAVGISKIANPFLRTLPGQIYLASKDMLTAAISAVILIVVGYGLCLRRHILVRCGRAVLCRLAIQLILLAVTMFLLRSQMSGIEEKAALVLYSLLPPTFVIPVYAKSGEDAEYLSTTISAYFLITLVIFAAITFFV